MAHECYNRIIWLLRMDFDGFKIKSSSTLAVSIYGCPYGMLMYVASVTLWCPVVRFLGWGDHVTSHMSPETGLLV